MMVSWPFLAPCSPPETGASTKPKPDFSAIAASSRAMVADVALPGIFARLKGLRLDASEPVRIGGWAFRGLLNLSVKWDVN